MKVPKIKSELIAAFPGTGKTHYCNSDYMPQNFAIDSDSSRFEKSAFPQNYIEHIKENIGVVCKIFISSHKEVRESLVANNLPFTLVYPQEDLKDEYLKRYKERGSSEAFIALIDKNWSNWLGELREQKGCKHIELKSGEYLSTTM